MVFSRKGRDSLRSLHAVGSIVDRRVFPRDRANLSGQWVLEARLDFAQETKIDLLDVNAWGQKIR